MYYTLENDSENINEVKKFEDEEDTSTPNTSSFQNNSSSLDLSDNLSVRYETYQLF